MENANKGSHVWERAGLGNAPYKFTGFSVSTYQACSGAPIQPGSSCDYCGAGIRDVFTFRSANGKAFKVGSSCCRKSGDKYITTVAQREMRKVNLERRHVREAAKIEQAKTLLASDSVRANLQTQPHPNDWRASEGDTLLNWAEWMMDHSGNAGKLRVLKVLKNNQ